MDKQPEREIDRRRLDRTLLADKPRDLLSGRDHVDVQASPVEVTLELIGRGPFAGGNPQIESSVSQGSLARDPLGVRSTRRSRFHTEILYDVASIESARSPTDPVESARDA
jgi:hypothetical protein